MVKNIENKMQSLAMDAYKKTARRSATVLVPGEENTFKREYAQALVKDYFYSEQQIESPKDKKSHLQKLKASIESLELPADFKISYHAEELSLDGFVKLLETEMASFEENKAEKKEEELKKEEEKIKNLSDEEIENIVEHTKDIVTLGDIEKFRKSNLKVAQRKQLPPEVLAQIKKHYENQGISYTPKHEEISIRILEKGIELSPEICCNLDSLLRVRSGQTGRSGLEEMAKDYRGVKEIKVEDFLPKGSYSRSQVEKIVKDLQELDENYLQKIGTTFRTIEEALNNYHAFQGAEGDKAVAADQTQIRFQYVRYQMTLEKALTLNSRGIQIDKTELITIERELMRLEVSAESIDRIAAKEGISQEAMLDKIIAAEHSKMLVMGSDYSVLTKLTTGSTLTQVAELSLQNIAMQAVNRYDALGTQVRKDLGDSMNKAFYRLNSLLLANRIEATTDNLRAAAILGKGQVEINLQNIEQIKEIDVKLQKILKGLTPEIILEQMEKEVDVLSLNINQLANIAEEADSKEFRRISERVARKISQLEKQNAISPEQRENLVLFYRLLHTIEQAEGAAAAVLMKDNREITLENMYDVAKYLQNHTSIDEMITQEMGLSDEKERQDLKTQIRHGFLQKKTEIRQFMRSMEQEIFREMGDFSAKQHLETLKNYNQKEWDALFSAWKNPTLADVEMYKEFQKIPFMWSDSLRKLEKATEKNDKAKDKLNKLKAVLESANQENGYAAREEQIHSILKELEADWLEAVQTPEKEIFHSIVEVRKQWQYQNRLSKEKDFTQIAVWSGKELHQVNVYFPKEKRQKVRQTGEVNVLLSFEMRKAKITGMLESNAKEKRLLLDVDQAEMKTKIKENHQELLQIFAEHGLRLDMIAFGTFRESTPFSEQGFDSGYKIEEELSIEKSQELFNGQADPLEWKEETIFALSAELAKALYRWDN